MACGKDEGPSRGVFRETGFSRLDSGKDRSRLGAPLVILLCYKFSKRRSGSSESFDNSELVVNVSLIHYSRLKIVLLSGIVFSMP